MHQVSGCGEDEEGCFVLVSNSVQKIAEVLPKAGKLDKMGAPDIVDSREGAHGIGNIIGAMRKGHYHGREDLHSITSDVRGYT